MRLFVTCCLVSGLAATGCGAPSVYARKPSESPADSAVIALWAESIREHGESGDWLLTRNYALVGDLIAAVSFRDESLSHAAIYDKERDMVIEATSPKVQAVPLERFLRRYRRVVLARPKWLSYEQQLESMERARKLVGEPYDWAGLFGIDDESRYYCSEFVLVVADRDGFIDRPLWVTPAALLDVADVIYDGGVRDEERVVRAAHKRRLRAQNRSKGQLTDATPATPGPS